MILESGRPKKKCVYQIIIPTVKHTNVLEWEINLGALAPQYTTTEKPFITQLLAVVKPMLMNHGVVTVYILQSRPVIKISNSARN